MSLETFTLSYTSSGFNICLFFILLLIFLKNYLYPYSIIAPLLPVCFLLVSYFHIDCDLFCAFPPLRHPELHAPLYSAVPHPLHDHLAEEPQSVPEDCDPRREYRRLLLGHWKVSL